MTTRISPLAPPHAEGMFTALSDPRIYEFLDERTPKDVDAVSQTIKNLLIGGPPDGSERWLNWSVFRGSDIVGYTQATVNPDKSAIIAYVLNPSVWGTGVAYEACCLMITELSDVWKIDRFLADTEIGNVHSQRLLQRLEFKETSRVGVDVFFERSAL